MSKRDINLYVSDIIEAIAKIEEYTNSLSMNQFLKDAKTIDAVVRNLSVIGEAISNIPREIKRKYPNVPWTEIKGMRNKIIHEYFGVDEKILWETVKSDLPAFKRFIVIIFKDSNKK